MRLSLPWTKKTRPDGGDSEAINKLREMVSNSQNEMQKRHRQWRLFDEYYEGIHLINKDIKSENGVIPVGSADKDRKPLNLIKATIEAIVPLIMDARPMWYVLSEVQGAIGMTLAEDVSDYLRGFWYWDKMDEKHEEVVRDMLIYGTGVKRVRWDRFSRQVGNVDDMVSLSSDGEQDTITEYDGVNYVGDITTEWVDPFRFIVDPAASSLDEARYAGVVVAISEDDFERQFPKADIGDVSRDVPSDYSKRDKATTNSLNINRDMMIEIVEIYYDYGTKLAIFTGDQMLWHGDNPTPDNKFPFVMYKNVARGGVMWGQSEVKDLIAVNDFVNLINYRVARNQRFSGNQQMVTNDDSIAEVTNEPGALHKVRARVAGGEKGYITWLNPPPLDVSVFTWMQTLLRLFDMLSGVHDVTQGIMPEGSRATGVAFSSMDQAAQRRVRLMVSCTSRGLEREGQIMLEFMQENYAEPRAITFMGDSGIDSTTLEDSALRHTLLSNGNPMPFRVVVQHRGDLPRNPVAMVDMARQFYLDGLIDQEEVLKQARWPERHTVMQRMSAAQQARVQGQMAAMQGQAPPGMEGQMGQGGGGAMGQAPSQDPIRGAIAEAFGPEMVDAISGIIQSIATKGPEGLDPQQQQLIAQMNEVQREQLKTIIRSIG